MKLVSCLKFRKVNRLSFDEKGLAKQTAASFILSNIPNTVQKLFLIWISRQTKNLHSPKTISYSGLHPPDKQKSEIWGNLTKISHQFLRREREDVIPFWKFWTVLG